MRSKAQIHALTGHTNTVAVIKCQAADPQVGRLDKHDVLIKHASVEIIMTQRYTHRVIS